MNKNYIIFGTGKSIFTTETDRNENYINFLVIFKSDSDLNENLLPNSKSDFYDERFQDEHKNVIVFAIENNYEVDFKTNFSAANSSSPRKNTIDTEVFPLRKSNRQSVLVKSPIPLNPSEYNFRTDFLKRIKIIFEKAKHGQKDSKHHSNLLWKTNKAVYFDILREIYCTLNFNYQSNYLRNTLNFDSPLVYLVSDAKRSSIILNELSNHFNSNKLIWNLSPRFVCKHLEQSHFRNLCAQFIRQCIVDFNWRQLLKSNLIRNANYVNILVLGAGLAGLGAAYTIDQSSTNCSYVILEAQNRIGGRIQTTKLLKYPTKNDTQNLLTKYRPELDNNLVDAGAQWLHGKFNKLYELSNKYDLLSPEQSNEALGQFLYKNNIGIDDFLIKKVDFIIGEILEECEQYARMDFRSKDFKHPKSVEAFLRERFKSVVQTFKCPNERKTAWDLFDWHLRFQIIDNSCLTLDHVSAKYWGKYSYNGESCQAHYNFQNGFTDVLTAVVSGLKENCIKFDKNVVSIEIHSEDHTRPRATVACSDGTVYMADHVLVTFSLGVLKTNHKKLFHPRLPNQFEQTIIDMGFETINKIFLQFNEAWWGELDGVQFVYDKNDTSDKHWTRDISGFDVLNPGPKNTLLGWVGGQGAMEMEKLTDQQIINDCLKLLSNFTKLSIPTPINYFCTKWASNQFAKGAYSYISTDCDGNLGSSNLLKEPLFVEDFMNRRQLLVCKNKETNKSPVLLFAGEACHDKYFSTAHGAFLSGIEQIEQVLAFYN